MEHNHNSRAAIARPGEADFWPADSLAAWSQEAAGTFQTWLAQQRILGTRQFRESTKETYCAMFAAWMSFLDNKRMSLLEATDKEAQEFFGDSALVPVSRRRYLQLLDKVYQHLLSLKWTGDHPLRGLLKLERELSIALPVGLDRLQLEQVQMYLANASGSKACRDRAMAALLVGAGLRSNEIIRLQCLEIGSDFAIEVKSHTVHREHATVVLPDGPWRKWIQEWRAERTRQRIPGELFCPATASGKAFTASGLFRRIARWFELSAVQPGQGGANVLRNTFARLALESGRYGVSEVRDFMGHEDIRTTQRHLAMDVPTPIDGGSFMGANKYLEFTHATEVGPTKVDLLSSSSARR